MAAGERLGCHPGCEDGGRSHQTGGLEAGKGQEMDSPRASRRNTALLPPVRAMSESDFQNWKKLNVCLKPVSLL